MKQVQIFDVDGTLTYNKIDWLGSTSFESFSFWPLISNELCYEKKALQLAVRKWKANMKIEHDADQSSFEMMQRTVETHFHNSVTGEDLVRCAQAITQQFIEQKIIQMNAIDYIRTCLENDIICVLTTGSYLDGLQGFVEVLIKEGYLPKSKNLYINGAEFDWERKVLMHANIGSHKVTKLKSTLHGIDYKITAAFGDDPYVNDKGILELALEHKAPAIVIKSKKNKQNDFNSDFQRYSWAEYLSS
jgi:hypothetical protein